MSKLENLEEELYGKEAEGKLAKRMRHKEELPLPHRSDQTSWQEYESPPPPQNTKRPRFFIFDYRALILLLGGLVFLAVFAGAIFVYFYFQTQGKEAEIAIFSRDTAESGERVTFSVVVKNVSRYSLEDGEVVLVLPSGSILIEEGEERSAPSRLVKKISPVQPRGEETIEVAARIFGSEFEERKIDASFHYRPENLRARFTARASKAFTINRVPIAISWEVPELVTQNQEMELRVDYISNARAPFDDLSFRIEYPPGFKFISADPKPGSGETIWRIGTLDPGGGGSIRIRGIITGQEGETKAFRGSIGLYNSATRDWKPYVDASQDLKFSTDPLSVRISLGRDVENIIVPGAHPTFFVYYRNNTPVILRNVSILVSIEGGIILKDTIFVSRGGVFDGARQAIIWGPGNIPELREVSPGKEGEFSFSVQTRAQPVMRSATDKNLLVKVKSLARPGDIPPELAGTDLESEHSVEFKVSSKVIFSGKSVYRTSPIKNLGPLPPKVGAETTYVIVWEVKNFTNDLKNTEIRATLPPNIKWGGAVFPSDAKITFSESSSEVRWNIENVPAGTGVISKSMVAAFQVVVTPSQIDAGRAIPLVNEARLTALDSFTGSGMDEKIDPLTTETRQDTLTNPKEWQVVR
ncbi:MAG: hypothetical protein HYT98_02960 [Candidatus Sungbacteria bacterium]|nr:hypothetical protein [Candidatus Sungbacteria bacterium]